MKKKKQVTVNLIEHNCKMKRFYKREKLKIETSENWEAGHEITKNK